MLVKYFKKGMVIFLLGLSLTIFTIPAARAQSEQILLIIAKELKDILDLLNEYIPNIAKSSAIWLDTLGKDSSNSEDQAAIDMIKKSADLNTAFNNNFAAQNNADKNKALNDTLFGSTPPQNANDLTYQTLLKMPYYSPDPRGNTAGDNAPLNYIKNAAGLMITHPTPLPNWRGSASNKTKYLAYYNTISSVQTYNGYILNGLYADASNSPLTPLQNDLMTQASSQNWFTQVSGESLGKVVREILIYDSQIYVQLIQLLQVEKQLLAAMTMSNTLFIVGNQFTENDLVGKAKGTTPGST
jgi:hypothetical protein